ncbi:MAG TPA: hypothetical protein VGS78_11640 [Candidatus Sulfotelmatobacter sp.]|nr:hypothetical protein [Candidatus Sulfotelmatobacter sp.]
MRRHLLLILLCALSPSVSAAEKPWIEIRSEHFRVISNGDTEDALAIAREFEQMRAVFAMGAQNMRLDSGAPLTIFAPRDLSTMSSIYSWERPNPSIAGVFHTAWERQYAVVRLDLDQPGRFQPVYHEYVHSLLHMNFRWLPLWLDEGLAELYGTSQFKNASALVGVPNERRYVLERQNLIPLKQLFTITQGSPYYRGGMQMQVFYAESWGLCHFLIFSDGMGQGKRMVEFYNLIQSGTDQEKAFEQVFGPISDIESKLKKYATKGKMEAWEIKSPPQIFARNFGVRTLTKAEVDAELGAFNLWVTHQKKKEQELIPTALKEDPKLASAHEDLAFLDFSDGKDQDASQEFETALQSDPTRYLSIYYKTMLSPLAKSSAPADEALFEKGLAQTLRLNPQFAPAYVQAAMLYVRKGQLNRALVAAHKAAELEPSRAGYALLESNLLLQLGRMKEAGAIIQYVADRWQGPDRDEALELWNKLSHDQRPSLAPVPETPPDGTDASKKEASEAKEATGTIASSVCQGEGKDHSLTITLQSNGQSTTFRDVGHGLQMGFSDTVWYGRDHFSLCHHVEGLRAVIRYKPNSDPKNPADLVEVEVRVDLPTSPAPPQNSASATEQHH